jgi:SET domain-containing protein
MTPYKNRTNTYRVGRSDAGLGLFANKDIAKDEFIIEYTGEKISHAEADRRMGRYLFTLTDRIVLDGKGREHTARYINHSCDPNAETVIEDDRHVMVYAIKDIKKGEEITYDYGEEYVTDIIQKEGCRCKSCQK